MSRTVWVGAGAREAFRALDGALQEEVITQVVIVAESPAEHLVRAGDKFPGLYVARYASTVSPGMTVTLYFDGVDTSPQRLGLVGITHVLEDGPTV